MHDKLIIGNKFRDYIKKIQIEMEEVKANKTPSELASLQDIVDTYMLWSNIQLMFHTNPNPYSATIIFFTPPQKDEVHEKGKV